MGWRNSYSFRREDYATIVALVTDKDWPETFDEWSDLYAKDVREAEARGDVVKQAIIDPAAFSRYCASIGAERNEAALGAFATAVIAGYKG